MVSLLAHPVDQLTVARQDCCAGDCKVNELEGAQDVDSKLIYVAAVTQHCKRVELVSVMSRQYALTKCHYGSTQTACKSV